MSETQFLAMISAYAIYYGPMMDVWRIIFLALSVLAGIVLGIFLMLQRGLSTYF